MTDLAERSYYIHKVYGLVRSWKEEEKNTPGCVVSLFFSLGSGEVVLTWY